jgi:hypothetical protein
MEFDIGSILQVVNFVFANKLVLGGVIGLFVGWNLPQPSWAKFVQDKIVTFFGGLWNKAKGE